MVVIEALANSRERSALQGRSPKPVGLSLREYCLGIEPRVVWSGADAQRLDDQPVDFGSEDRERAGDSHDEHAGTRDESEPQVPAEKRFDGHDR